MKSLTSLFPLPASEFSFASFDWPRRSAHAPLRTIDKRRQRYVNPVTSGYYHSPSPLNKWDVGVGFYLGCDSGGSSFDLRVAAVHDQPFSSHVKISHTGWFLDEHQIDVVYGIVAKLPSNGGDRFLAGYSLGLGMISFLEREVLEDIDQAVNRADELARKTGEQSIQEAYERMDVA